MNIKEAAKIIANSKLTTVFTGAGISVESGIPPFRGKGGLWEQYDPQILDLSFYLNQPNDSWPVIKKLFYDFFGEAKPNNAHKIIANWETNGIIEEIITQNIDCLHQKAGSNQVYEFHGTSNSFICTECNRVYKTSEIDITDAPPLCHSNKCKGLLKPNFIFFGEGIPAKAYESSLNAANNSDCFLIIGTTGEIMPASQIPLIAKQNNCHIIEINTEYSQFTNTITDVFLQGKATTMMKLLDEELNSLLTK